MLRCNRELPEALMMMIPEAYKVHAAQESLVLGVQKCRVLTILVAVHIININAYLQPPKSTFLYGSPEKSMFFQNNPFFSARHLVTGNYQQITDNYG